MRFFLRFLSPDDATGGGAAADAGAGAAAADTSGAAAAGADTSAAGDAGAGADGPQYLTQAQHNAADAADILGGLPNVPRGTSGEPAAKPAATADAGAAAAAAAAAAAGGSAAGADAGAGAAAAGAGAAATGAAAAAAAPALDLSKIADGRFKSEAELTAALTAADTAAAQLNDPKVRALVEIATDPTKFDAFVREQGRDYVAEAKADPKAMLFEQFKQSNPQFSEASMKTRFEMEYKKTYPDLDLNDSEDPDYQQSVMLRDEDAELVGKKLAADQLKKREEMLAVLPKQPEPVAAAPGLTDAELAAHAAAVIAVDAALKDYTVNVPAVTVMVAGQPVNIEAQAVPVDLADREAVRLFTDDMVGFLEKQGGYDDKGNVNYTKMQEIGLKAINHDANMAAALKRGIELGIKQGVASLVQPGASAAPAVANPGVAGAAGAAAAAASTAQANQNNTYASRQAAHAENFPDY